MARLTPVRFAASALALAAVAACRPAAPSPPGVTDLLAPAAAPDLLGETGELGPRALGDLASGFFAPEGQGAEEFIWAGEGPVRIPLEFASARSRWVEIEAAAFTWPSAPVQTVDVALDDRRLGSFSTFGGAWASHSLAVPAELSVPGRHQLELRFAHAVAPGEVEPGSSDPRRLSVALRAVRVLPPAAAPAPELAGGRLSLPCGGRAAWATWFAAGARLEVAVDPVGGAREARFTVETDGAAPRLLLPGGGFPLAGPARLVLACPEGAEGRLEVRRLLLEEPIPVSPTDSTAEPARVLIVVGSLTDGFPVVPCSCDPDRALRCLLSGLEAAAFGFAAPPALDRVTASPAEAVAALAATPPPAVVALVTPGESAEAGAAAVAAEVPGVRLVLTSLPVPGASGEPLVRARVPGSTGRPLNASQLDLLPTAWRLSGRVPLRRFSGTDLSAALRPGPPSPVRPIVALWDRDRSLAFAADRIFELPIDGERPAWRGITEEVVDRWLQERREALEWLAP